MLLGWVTGLGLLLAKALGRVIQGVVQQGLLLGWLQVSGGVFQKAWGLAWVEGWLLWLGAGLEWVPEWELGWVLQLAGVQQVLVKETMEAQLGLGWVKRLAMGKGAGLVRASLL